MEKDGVRKVIFEEIHSQFETKLREAKRQKSQAEEELESLTEKWRSERRRLNTEIDRLESALSDARENRLKSGGSKGRGIDPAELTKLQAASEETLKNASQEWDTERTKLRTEVTRLQMTVADLIERSNNPLRGNQPLPKEALDIRQKQRDSEFQAAKAAFEKEKLELTSEISRLRQQTGDKSTEDIERQLSEAIRARTTLERDLQRARKDAEVSQESMTQELDELRDELKQSRRKADSGSGLAEELKEAKEAARTIRTQESAEREKLAEQLEQARAENSRVRASHEQELQKSRDEIDALQKQFSGEMAALQAELKRADQQGTASSSAVSAKTEEAAKQRDLLQQQLQKANELVRSIRAEHSQERTQWTTQMEAARAEADKVRKELEAAKKSPAQPADSSKGAPAKQADSNGGLAHQLQEALQQRNFLQQQVHQANEAVRSIRGEQTKEHAALTAQLDESKTQIRHLEQRLNGNNGAVDTEVVEQLRKQYDGRIQEMIQQKTKLTEELNKASSMLEAERKRFATAAATTAAPAAEKSTRPDATRINEELARVEGLLKGLATLIDDPSTELSTVIRKNVERAEWDSYLKGILFSLGRGDKK